MSVAYQPLWRDGRQVGTGQRPSDDRWQLIAPLLDDVPEPFTLLDVGAYTGYFSARAVDSYDCDALAIDSRADLKPYRRMKVDRRRIDPAGLARLPRHDVVLALSVLHHFADWQRAFTELCASRRHTIFEVPHPDERWMRRSASRHAVAEQHDVVSSAGTLIGTSPRTSPDGTETFDRPLYAVEGTVRTFQGEAFTGSGSNSRSLRKYADERLVALLGYEPFPGSLNLRVGDVDLGEPPVRWERTIRGNSRAYAAWRAWYSDVAGHVMVPTARKAHPSALEGWAPVKLRDRFGIVDGDTVTVDVESGR